MAIDQSICRTLFSAIRLVLKAGFLFHFASSSFKILVAIRGQMKKGYVVGATTHAYQRKHGIPSTDTNNIVLLVSANIVEHFLLTRKPLNCRTMKAIRSAQKFSRRFPRRCSKSETSSSSQSSWLFLTNSSSFFAYEHDE